MPGYEGKPDKKHATAAGRQLLSGGSACCSATGVSRSSSTGWPCSKRPERTSPWGDRRPWHTGQLLRLRLLLAL